MAELRLHQRCIALICDTSDCDIPVDPMVTLGVSDIYQVLSLGPIFVLDLTSFSLSGVLVGLIPNGFQSVRHDYGDDPTEY